MAKYCKNCGFPIFENDKECENCGMSIPNNEKVEKKNKIKTKKENGNKEYIQQNSKENNPNININLLIETAKNIETLEKELLKSKSEMIQYKAKLWTNTDFKHILNLKQPTLTDRESYINLKMSIYLWKIRLLNIKLN